MECAHYVQAICQGAVHLHKVSCDFLTITFDGEECCDGWVSLTNSSLFLGEFTGALQFNSSVTMECGTDCTD